MLDVKNINQYYGGSHILRDVSLHLIQRSLREHGAIAQHGDNLADGADKAHVVLHHHQ